MSHHLMRRALLNSQPLLTQFIHDTRTDVIKYSSNWQVIPGLPTSEPYRGHDTVRIDSGANPTADPGTMDFRFTSKGRIDELISLHAVFSDHLRYEVVLNGTLIGKTDTILAAQLRFLRVDSPQYFRNPAASFFSDPWMIIRPSKGVNHLRLTYYNANDLLYLDGIGCVLRGGPIPV